MQYSVCLHVWYNLFCVRSPPLSFPFVSQWLPRCRPIFTCSQLYTCILRSTMHASNEIYDSHLQQTVNIADSCCKLCCDAVGDYSMWMFAVGHLKSRTTVCLFCFASVKSTKASELSCQPLNKQYLGAETSISNLRWICILTEVIEQSIFLSLWHIRIIKSHWTHAPMIKYKFKEIIYTWLWFPHTH